MSAQRSTWLHIRVTPDERAEVEQKAKAEQRGLSQWLRVRLGFGGPSLNLGPDRGVVVVNGPVASPRKEKPVESQPAKKSVVAGPQRGRGHPEWCECARYCGPAKEWEKLQGGVTR